MMGPDGDGEQLNKVTVFVVETGNFGRLQALPSFRQRVLRSIPSACLGTKSSSVVAILGSDPVMA